MLVELNKFQEEIELYFKDKTQDKLLFDTQVKIAGEELGGMKEKLKSKTITQRNILNKPISPFKNN